MPTGSASGSFGSLLRRARTAAALSQEELAERAGVSARGVSDLERGLRRAPRLETVRMLADALGLDAASRAALLSAARAPAADAELAPRSVATLPEPPTRLVGREREMAELTRLLGDDGVRLLTLTGPGGSGKTRLAIAVATQASDRFPDGVVFVDLAPLADASLVLASIAQGVGLRTPGADLAAAMRAFLAGKRMLLVLDNFEHVLAAAGVVADLLRALPALAMLTTSREPLRLRGEREFAVQPLGVPEAGSVADPAQLLERGAVSLFVERVRDVRADFALTRENALVVADICRRLDGLPLALELAAARVRGLPLTALRERLEVALPLLTGGARDAPARQRSLRETIAWSFDLLSREEQAMFRRLGVFAGGWTLDAAEAVAAVESGLDVMMGLASLVDKSLVRLDERGAVPRYRMLETVREFALDQLVQSGEAAEIRRAHAAFFAEMVIAAENGLSAGVLADVARIAGDIDNLRAALAWLLDTGDSETALRMAASMSEYWMFASRQLSEGRAWLAKALEQGGATSMATRSAALYGAAMMANYQADYAAARAAAREGLALARVADADKFKVANALALASADLAEGRSAEAMTLAIEAEATAREIGDHSGLGWMLELIGAIWYDAREFDRARTALEEAVALFRSIGGRWGESDVLTLLARVARGQGDLSAAAAFHAESLSLMREMVRAAGIQNDLIGLADVALGAGDLEAAARLLGAADAYASLYGYTTFHDSPAIGRRVRATLDDRMGTENLSQGLVRGRALDPDDAISEALAIAERLSEARPDEGRG